MFEFSFWDIVKGLLVLPFFLLKAIINNMNPFKAKKDKEIVNTIYNFMNEEAKLFAEYLGKGQIELSKGRVRNMLPTEIHIEFYYGDGYYSIHSSDDQHRIAFLINRENDYFSFGTGGRSGIGFSRVKKDDIDYEKIITQVYSTIENSYSKEYREWQNKVFKPLLRKYDIDESNYSLVRRAHIVNILEPSSTRYIKAKKELLIFFEDEKIVNNFIEEIDDIYSAKVVYEALI